MIKLINAYTLSECLEEIAEQVAAYEALGQKNLVFCEDRLTLVAERAIMRRLGGSFLTEITTFSRFLKTNERVLSREGAVMSVAEIMLRLQKEGALKCFVSEASVLSGAKCIYEQLAQFGASELTPDFLRENVQLLPEDALKNKMTDLALIYEHYQEFLEEEGYLDESKYLTLLPETIKNERGMSETNVFFLCYSSFTRQAKRTLWSTFEAANNVIGIFIAGEEEIYTNQAYAAFDSLSREFSAGAKAVYRTKNAGKPLSGEAEILRRTLFATESLSLDKGAAFETEAIRVLAASNRAGEAEYAAVYIRKRMMENPELRYRDFAVLTPSVAEYSLAIRKAFSEYAIPYSMDERISLKQHPLAKFILAVMESVREGYAPEAVDAVAKNVFFGNADRYRNYLLKYANFRGGVFKRIKEFHPEKETDEKRRKAVENEQAEFVERFGSFSDLQSAKLKLEAALSLFQGKHCGSDYCDSVRALLKEFNAGQVLNELLANAEDEGMRSYLSQIEKKMDGVLTEAELLAGEKPMSLDDFYTLLSDGLEATEIAPNPLRIDSVFVGDITDSRIERVRVLFALGMTDAVPRASDDANLITDQDKIRLQAIQAAIEPMVEEVNLRNRESLALNLCTFTDALYLTYSLGANGEEPALSDVFRYVKSAFVTSIGCPIADEKGIPAEDFAYQCSAFAPAARQLFVCKNDYLERKTDSLREYSSLYDALLSMSALPERIDGTLSADKYLKQGEELYLSKGAPSPSLLETYFSCPYQCFASRGLYLEERQEQTVLAVDTGNYIHKLLEEITDEIRSFPDEDSFAKRAEEVGRSLMNDEKLLPKEDTLAGVYSAEKLLAEGVEVARAVYRQITDSAFDTVTKEKVIETSNVRGKVDRVDENDRYVRVVDYKTGTISADIKDYYGGLKLQMELYMSAVRGDKIPAGVLYFPASVEFSASSEGRFRMQGFLNSDEEAICSGDTTLNGETKSEHFEAARVKNRLGKAMPGEMFTDFLDYALYVSAGAKEELAQGYIAPSPIKKDGRKSACTWCKFGGMCGFSKEQLSFRTLPSVSSKKLVDVVRKCKEEKGDE